MSSASFFRVSCKARLAWVQLINNCEYKFKVATQGSESKDYNETSEATFTQGLETRVQATTLNGNTMFQDSMFKILTFTPPIPRFSVSNRVLKKTYQLTGKAWGVCFFYFLLPLPLGSYKTSGFCLDFGSLAILWVLRQLQGVADLSGQQSRVGQLPACFLLAKVPFHLDCQK